MRIYLVLLLLILTSKHWHYLVCSEQVATDLLYIASHHDFKEANNKNHSSVLPSWSLAFRWSSDNTLFRLLSSHLYFSFNSSDCQSHIYIQCDIIQPHTNSTKLHYVHPEPCLTMYDLSSSRSSSSSSWSSPMSLHFSHCYASVLSSSSSSSYMSYTASRSATVTSDVACFSFERLMAANPFSLFCLSFERWSIPHTKQPLTTCN